MGAKWQRDTSGQSKPAPKPPAFQQPIRPGKRKLVWTKDQQDQPAPSRPGQSNGHLNPGPAGPYDQYDHFEKRARLNQDFQGYQGAQHHRHVIQQQAPYPASDRVKPPTNGEQHHKHASHQQAPHTKPVGANAPANDTQQQPPLARQDPAAVLAQRQKAAELAELKRRIQLQEDALKRQKVTCGACLSDQSTDQTQCTCTQIWVA